MQSTQGTSPIMHVVITSKHIELRSSVKNKVQLQKWPRTGKRCILHCGMLRKAEYV